MTRWQRFLCNFMGWHKVERYGFNGCNAVGVCTRCKRTCLQDSTGAWF